MSDNVKRLCDCTPEEWYAAAEQQTAESIGGFIRALASTKCEEKNGNIEMALASMVAALNVLEKEYGYKFSQVQKECMAIEIQRALGLLQSKAGVHVLDYDDMLDWRLQIFFANLIGESAWETLQKEAARRLEKWPEADEKDRVHWQSIVDGKVPFGYTVMRKGCGK